METPNRKEDVLLDEEESQWLVLIHYTKQISFWLLFTGTIFLLFGALVFWLKLNILMFSNLNMLAWGMWMGINLWLVKYGLSARFFSRNPQDESLDKMLSDARILWMLLAFAAILASAVMLFNLMFG